MAVAALLIYLARALPAFGLRTWPRWRRTNDTGIRGTGSRRGGVQWWGRFLFVGALVIGATGPVAAPAGLETVAGHAPGAVT